MSDGSVKPWKKTEDIPRRFDELPPEPGWVPVADVIRTHREDEARQQERLNKIKPPLDSDSESEAEDPVRREGKEEETPTYEEDEKKDAPPRKFDDTSVPPTVDDVTQSMVNWALRTDGYQRRPKPKPPAQLREQIKPLVVKQKPSHRHLQDKRYDAKESPNKSSISTSSSSSSSSRQPSKASTDGNKHYTSPHKNYGEPHNQVGISSSRTQPPASDQAQQEPPYDIPTPDYEDEDYDAYHSRYAERHSEGVNDCLYYYDEEPADRYQYDYQEYQYDYQEHAYAPYGPQQGYRYPQDGYGYEDDEQLNAYHDETSHYPQAPYDSVLQDYSRAGRPSSCDVLY